MSIGIALYHTNNLSGQQSFHLASSFFKLINKNITDVSYRDELDTYQSTVLNNVAHVINTKEIKGFRVYNKDENNPPWLVSFGYTANSQVNFDYIDIQCAISISEATIVQFLKEVVVQAFVPYGIVYVNDNVVDSYEYVLEEGVIPVPSYEQHFLWRDETPIFLGGARYENNMLRMVYPYNLINANHLKIPVGNKTLEEMIKEDKCFGVLLSTANTSSFIWQVAAEHVEYVNSVCGKAGILVAWNNA